MKFEKEVWFIPQSPIDENLREDYPWSAAGTWTWQYEGCRKWRKTAYDSRETARVFGSCFAKEFCPEEYIPDAKILTGRREKGDDPHHYKIVDIESHTRLKDGEVGGHEV